MTDSTVALRENEEVWELTVPGRIHIEVTNIAGRPQPLTVSGVGQRLRIKTTDRQIVQERVRNAQNDPFLNGMLVRIDGRRSESERSPEELNDADLAEVFQLDRADFEAMVDAFGEVNVRRLEGMATAEDASVNQVDYLKKSIATRWPITSGSTKTYDEMMRTPD